MLDEIVIEIPDTPFQTTRGEVWRFEGWNPPVVEGQAGDLAWSASVDQRTRPRACVVRLPERGGSRVADIPC